MSQRSFPTAGVISWIFTILWIPRRVGEHPAGRRGRRRRRRRRRRRMKESGGGACREGLLLPRVVLG
jgi:hypothetical protein